MESPPRPAPVAPDINDLASKCDLFIDNAATASQTDFDDVTREAIRLNVFAPMLSALAALSSELAEAKRERDDAIAIGHAALDDVRTYRTRAADALSCLAREGWRPGPDWKFERGERVTKIKGSSWTGRVVGFYSTALTPRGYDVESENEPGSVQLYPESALAAAPSVEEKLP